MGHAPSPHVSHRDDRPVGKAAKVDSSFSIFVEPHLSHLGAGAEADLWSTSLTRPHFPHLYS
jgi:hypothetical protein